MSIHHLNTDALYHSALLSKITVNSTKHIKPLNDIIGQERAKQAVAFAMSIKDKGYNIYAIGENGLGKKTMVLRYLASHVGDLSTIYDWCYVENFANPRCPCVLQLPAGRASALKQDLEALLQKLAKGLPLAFDNEMYYSRAEVLTETLAAKQQQALQQIGANAKAQGIELAVTTEGEYQFTALNGEEAHTDQSFAALPEQQQQQIENNIKALQVQLRELARKLTLWEEAYSDQQQRLDEQVAKQVIDHFFAPLKTAYQDLRKVCDFLDAMYADILDNLDIFLEEQEEQAALAYASLENNLPRRYQLNVLVSQSPNQFPVVIEDSPSYHNIFGYVENTTFKGSVLTDFSLIRAGSIHRANGGVLLIDAVKLLERPYVWDGLKRALSRKKISLHSLEREMTLSGSVSLEPEEIPLNVKIILFGDLQTYSLLQHYDPEFSELFRVTADFEQDMPRTAQSELQYAQFIASICHENKMLHCEKSAIARIIEHSSRQAEDQHKLSLHSADIANLLREANYEARRNHANLIRASHVEKALASRNLRAGRFRDQVMQSFKDGIILTTTKGKQVGQINALSVLSSQDFSFGVPNRITATTSVGEGDVIDIERSVKLGGRIHTKGVMILTAYLGSLLGKTQPIPVKTTLAFEQSYAGVEGDSASMAEFCAVLSAISGVALRQDLAITGSMNQFGEAQAIGGVNEKIEGFFDLCTLNGTKNSQGVVIPYANLHNLMLRKDIIHAVAKGKFQLYAIEHVSDAVALFTGMPLGKRNSKGKLEPNTLLHLAQTKLNALSRAKPKH